MYVWVHGGVGQTCEGRHDTERARKGAQRRDAELEDALGVGLVEADHNADAVAAEVALERGRNVLGQRLGIGDCRERNNTRGSSEKEAQQEGGHNGKSVLTAIEGVGREDHVPPHEVGRGRKKEPLVACCCGV